MIELPDLHGVAGVAFDAVGTLIEPAPPVAAAYVAAAFRQGVVLERAEVKRRFALHFRQEEVDDLAGPLATDEGLESRRWRRIVTQVLPELPEPESAFSELWDHFGRPSAWRIYPDVLPVLAKLRAAGLPVVVASNFDARLKSVLTGHDGLAELAETAVISSLIGRRKPHPRFYEAVAAALGLDPVQVLFLGDDLENDVEGPRRVGMRGALVDVPSQGRRLEAIVGSLSRTRG